MTTSQFVHQKNRAIAKLSAVYNMPLSRSCGLDRVTAVIAKALLVPVPYTVIDQIKLLREFLHENGVAEIVKSRELQEFIEYAESPEMLRQLERCREYRNVGRESEGK
jgi:hypothetical protein